MNESEKGHWSMAQRLAAVAACAVLASTFWTMAEDSAVRMEPIEVVLDEREWRDEGWRRRVRIGGSESRDGKPRREGRLDQPRDAPPWTWDLQLDWNLQTTRVSGGNEAELRRQVLEAIAGAPGSRVRAHWHQGEARRVAQARIGWQAAALVAALGGLLTLADCLWRWGRDSAARRRIRAAQEGQGSVL